MLLVMMAGSPGSGKTTLAEGLVDSLGPRTFGFGEELLFEIAEFADVAFAFRTKAFPDTAMMLDAYRRFIDRVRDDADVVVFDWSCAGMIEDLPCAQPDRTSVTTHRPQMRSDPSVLASHARDVRGLADDAVLLVTQGDGSFLDAAVRYWEAGAPRKEDCVRAHSAGGWDVVRLDASAPARDVLDAALSVLRGY